AIHQIRPEYDSTVGQAARFQRDYDGKQPGDPAKAAQVILEVVNMDDPPIRLLLGSDALKVVQTADARKAAADRKWSALSASTDFVAIKT
ncbi:MAG TPA: short-chain dehydrogenase/reductase, partial [Allosphingosinicella sp.]|nr:short-chain dehydrogenase/reductase [Allosphingosinicella sp.]